MRRVIEIVINEPAAVQHYLLCEADVGGDDLHIVRTIAGRIDGEHDWRDATADELGGLQVKAEQQEDLLEQVDHQIRMNYQPIRHRCWMGNALVMAEAVTT